MFVISSLVLKVVEKKGDREEKLLSSKIAWLIGKGSLKEFENVRDPEITDFRVSMIEKCQRAIEQKKQFPWEELVLYCYPPDIESTTDISQLMAERLSPQVQLYIKDCIKLILYVATVYVTLITCTFDTFIFCYYKLLVT